MFDDSKDDFIEVAGGGGDVAISGSEQFIYNPVDIYAFTDTASRFTLWDVNSLTLDPTPKATTRDTIFPSTTNYNETDLYVLYTNEVDEITGLTLPRDLSSIFLKPPVATFTDPFAIPSPFSSIDINPYTGVFVITQEFDPTIQDYDSLIALSRTTVRFNIPGFQASARVSETQNKVILQDQGNAYYVFPETTVHGILLGTRVFGTLDSRYYEQVGFDYDFNSSSIIGVVSL